MSLLRRALAATVGVGLAVGSALVAVPAHAACVPTVLSVHVTPIDFATDRSVVTAGVSGCEDGTPFGVTVFLTRAHDNRSYHLPMDLFAEDRYMGTKFWTSDDNGKYQITVVAESVDGASEVTLPQPHLVVGPEAPPVEVAPPSKPRSVKVTKRTRTSGKVSWKAPASTGGSKVTGYRIVKPGKDVTVKATARSYTVKGLKAGRVYTVKVKAKNAAGYGPAVSVKVKTAAPVAKRYKSCAALTKVYPHGVGKPGAKDKTSGSRVTNFFKSTKVYGMNNGPRNVRTGEYDLDRDNDGIACER